MNLTITDLTRIDGLTCSVANGEEAEKAITQFTDDLRMQLLENRVTNAAVTVTIGEETTTSYSTLELSRGAEPDYALQTETYRFAANGSPESASKIFHHFAELGMIWQSDENISNIPTHVNQIEFAVGDINNDIYLETK